jgi:hypothetical protein
MMQRNQAANIEGDGKGTEEDVCTLTRARTLAKKSPFSESFRRASERFARSGLQF